MIALRANKNNGFEYSIKDGKVTYTVVTRDGLLHKLRGEIDSEKEQGEGETVAEGGGPRFSMGKKNNQTFIDGRRYHHRLYC